ncbi:hypothetical protein TWF281_004386 [Arthrobotrys megalospora]
MLSIPSLLALVALFYSSPSTSLSYSMLSIGDDAYDENDSLKDYIEERPLGCAQIPDTPTTDEANNILDVKGDWGGITINQDTWSPKAQWMGFWHGEDCNSQLPSLVIHWYPATSTDQTFDLRSLRQHLPDYSPEDYNFASWGEIVNIPKGMGSNMPPGSVAFRKGGFGDVVSETGEVLYRLYDNFIKIKSSPPNEMRDFLAGFDTRGNGRHTREFQATLPVWPLTRTLDGLGRQGYPLPPEVAQEIEQKREQRREREEMQRLLRQQAEPSNLAVEESMRSPASDQQSSPEQFPDVTLQMNMEAESRPMGREETEDVGENMMIAAEKPRESSGEWEDVEEEYDLEGYGAQDYYSEEGERRIRSGDDDQLTKAAEDMMNIQKVVEAAGQENLSDRRRILAQKQELDSSLLLPENAKLLELELILRNVGTSTEEIAQKVASSGADEGLNFALDKISSKRLQFEKNLLNLDEAAEFVIAEHPRFSKWRPNTLANILGDMRIRREVELGKLTPTSAGRASLGRTVLSNTERELARAAVQLVVERAERMRNQAQTQAQIQPGPDVSAVDDTKSFKDLLENIAPANSAAESDFGMNNNLASVAINKPQRGGDIELEEQVESNTGGTTAEAEQMAPAGMLLESVAGDQVEIE